jgi:hypothetical protein
MKKSLSIEFKINNKNFIPEFLVRFLLLLITLFYFKNQSESISIESSYIIGSLFIVLNFTISLLTLFGTSRRKETIVSFIKMRLNTDNEYEEFSVFSSSDLRKFYFISFINLLFFWGLTFYFFNILNLNEFINNIIVISTLPIYIFIIYKYKNSFISSEICAVYLDSKKISLAETEKIKNFIFGKSDEKTSHFYLNDGLIHDLEEKASIFKIRVETLLIESVFIGALTFGTFVQLTSPESVSSFNNIKNKENRIAEDIENGSFISNQHKKYKDSIVKLVYGEKKFRQNKLNPVASKNIDKLIDKFKNNYEYSHSSKGQSYGFLTNWAKERQQTIFSWFYKIGEKNSLNGIYEVLDLDAKKIDSTQLNKYEKNTKSYYDFICQDLREYKDSLITVFNHEKEKMLPELLKQDFINTDTLNANNLENLSKIIRVIDQIYLIEKMEINESDICNPYFKMTDFKFHKYLTILHYYDFDKFNKFYNVSKNEWDEAEYYFFISIGSVICSVLYISVLILRFPIILNIERLVSELKKATMWNEREEKMLANFYEYKIKNIDSKIDNISQTLEIDEQLLLQFPVLNSFNEKRKYYTEKLQIQLSKCEIISCNIQTNVQVVAFLRGLGLYTFFGVVLISTMMIDFRFTIFLGIILVYTIFGASFMQEGSNFKKFWRRIFHPSSYYKDENNLKNY